MKSPSMRFKLFIKRPNFIFALPRPLEGSSTTLRIVLHDKPIEFHQYVSTTVEHQFSLMHDPLWHLLDKTSIFTVVVIVDEIQGHLELSQLLLGLAELAPRIADIAHEVRY